MSEGKKNTIISRLVIARNMVIRLGNGCVDIGGGKDGWKRRRVCRTGNGHYDKTDTCSPATFTDDPDLGRRAQLPLARTWMYKYNVRVSVQYSRRRQQQQPLVSLCVRLSDTSFAIWKKSCRRWKVSMERCVSGSYACTGSFECC